MCFFLLSTYVHLNFVQVEEDFVLETEKEKFVGELQAIIKKAHEILQIHSMVGIDSPVVIFLTFFELILSYFV